MKVYIAICLERCNGCWEADAEILRNSRREIEDAVIAMLRDCVSSCDRAAGFEAGCGSYDYIFWSENDHGAKEIVFRYNIIEMEVPYF